MTSLSDAISLVDWCCQPPHTIDQILGIYGEVTAGQGRVMPSGLTAAELAQWLSASTVGTTDRTDPTTRAALPRSDDPAVQSIDAAIGQLHGLAVDLDDHACAVAGVAPWCPPVHPGRTERLRESTTRLHHARSLGLGDHGPDCDEYQHPLWERAYIETAVWLHDKALGIWQAAKGERHQVAEQKPRSECTLCSAWRSGTIATSRGRCEQCATFQDHHKCKPTEAIVRRWEATGSSATPPGLILEAKATSKRRTKVS